MGLWGACVCPRLFVCCVCDLCRIMSLCSMCFKVRGYVCGACGQPLLHAGRCDTPVVRVVCLCRVWFWAGCVWGQVMAAWKGRPPGLVGPASVGLVACCLSPPGGHMLQGTAEVDPALRLGPEWGPSQASSRAAGPCAALGDGAHGCGIHIFCVLPGGGCLCVG